MSSARSEILGRITAATRGSAVQAQLSASTGGRARLTRSRVSRASASAPASTAPTYRRVDDVAAAIAAACRTRGARRLAVPAGLPKAWRPKDLELVEDAELTPHELDGLDGVVTGCTLAIAETGTIVLTAAAAEGRRALTLVPDLHVCVVEETQVVELVPEAFAALAAVAGGRSRSSPARPPPRTSS